MTFKVGDWVIHEFKIGQIKKIDGDIITFSEGFFETSGLLAGAIVPLTLRNKAISDNVEYIYQKIHNNTTGLNYSNIRWKLIEIWLDSCNAKDDITLIAYTEELKDFETKLFDKYNSMKQEEVCGVKILK